ncbi:CRISPR-associated endonuclease Cas2, partial [bacterium]|nr:CRISPR-associated endonuclease Cas2 [candidate division CSSED10-310 bacterium]
MKTSLYVVSYDIRDDRRRNKVLRTMKGYGDRVQFSVFECILTIEQVKCCRAELSKLIDVKEDTVRVYR